MNSLNVLARVLLLASVLYVITEARTQCEDDWFGPDCQYQCHCVGSAPCNKHDGSCSSGCHRDWFGPACQYSKMAFRVYNQNLREMIWLTDSNDTTCNKWEHSTLNVALNTAIPLSWIRVVVKDTVKNFTIFLKFKNSNQTLKCGSSAIVDDRTYDIVCNTHDLVKDFYLSGAGVKSLCSLYISAGRNVALKQQTEQSSTYITWISSHAVDGKLDIPDNKDSQKATCTRTKWKDPGWWRLTFSQPAKISMFNIYNRRNPSWKNCCEQRLKGFHLTALDSQQVLLYEYIDQETERADMYIVRPHSMIKNVRVVQIEKGHPNWYLALCEVKVFGELSCEDGRYGLGCERQCNCVNQTSCFVHSGGCPSGCAAGYIGEDCSVCLTGRYGSECAEICSEKCGGDGNLCEQSGGACNQGCDPGYAGTHCQSLCPNGKYGPGCSESCNTECGGLTNACHHINGTCSYGCDAGYRGSMCDTECEAGSYGTGCLRLCSPHCMGSDSACHLVSGKCDKGCNPGYYGDRCSGTCGSHCAGPHKACDRTSGACDTGCDAGYYGSRCNKRCSSTCASCDRYTGACDSCNFGLYGNNCRYTCNSKCAGLHNACNRTSGNCIAGCDPGFRGEKCDQTCKRGHYGEKCNKTCSTNCAFASCHNVHGTCLHGCHKGYLGSLCTQKCPAGKYGDRCLTNCSITCAGPDIACNHVDGTCHDCDPGYRGKRCEQNCSTGYYGEGCNKTCSEHCRGNPNSCHHVNGFCIQGCDPGYTGSLCVQECKAGYYGQRCEKICSEHCGGGQRSCHHVNGTCNLGCASGFKGALCIQECTKGYYGEGCTNQCSDHCAGDRTLCHHVTGTCDLGCDSGYQGDLCTLECNVTTWGHNCSEKCSAKCKNNSCNHLTGECNDCVDGYWGRFCDHVRQREVGSHGVVSISVFLGTLFVVLVIIAVISGFFILKRRSQRKTEQQNNENDIHLSGMTLGPHIKEATGEETEAYTSEDAAVTGFTNPVTHTTAVSVEKLKSYIQQHSADSHFQDQFLSVPMTSGSLQTCGILPENIKKNRYKNIIPYDASRVLLQTVKGKKNSDYINASFVKGYKSYKAFIASQGPNDFILTDFVRMLWEQKVEKVVMLTKLVEEGKKKCSIYWPVEGEEEFDEVTVRLLTTHVFAEYTIRHLRLSKRGQTTRDLIQFHFTAWPDKSVPESPWGLVDLHHRVMAVPGSGPVLVHCSAGVGRTGTFIGLCNLLQEAEATGKMDFKSALWKLRQDRMHTIQTVEQYKYLHKVALVCYNTTGTIINVTDMYFRLASLESDKEGNKSTSSYQQEFETVVELCATTAPEVKDSPDEEVKNVYQNLGGDTNRMKDRLSNIVPNPTYRPDLTAAVPHEDTYINAVLVPNLTNDGHDILTQLPLPSTVTDFWRLVTQFNVGLIVAFDLDSSQSDETIADFLPKSETEPFENDRYLVEARQHSEGRLVSEFSLTVHQKIVPCMDDSIPETKKTLALLLCKSLKLDPESILDLQEQIRFRRGTGNARTIFMCRNGADYCGLMCVQSILLDRLKCDRCLAVPVVVGSIKAIRPQVIPTMDQYKCLYRVLKLAHDSQNVYGNLRDVSSSS